MIKLSIIIPCFNESDSLKLLLDKCIKCVSEEIEVILVDNGSTDDTYKKLSQSKLPQNLNFIKISKNIGYGHGIISGLNSAKGQIVSWTHADLQTDPFDVIEGFKKYEGSLIKKKCVVKGIRKKRNFIDFLFTLGMSFYCLIIMKKWMYDINAQPKIFHRDFLKNFSKAPLDFSLDLFWVNYFKQKKIKINIISVFFNKRIYGESKGGGSITGKIKLIKRTLAYINNFKN